MRRSELAKPTLVPDGVGRGENGSASTTYGWQNLGGITSPRTPSHQPLESLKGLERTHETIESRFYEACVILNLAMAHLVGQRHFTIDTTTTK